MRNYLQLEITIHTSKEHRPIRKEKWIDLPHPPVSNAKDDSLNLNLGGSNSNNSMIIFEFLFVLLGSKRGIH